MNLLIDGCIFGTPDEAQTGSFWKEILPKLPALLNGVTCHYLHRGPDNEPFDVEKSGYKNFNAPYPEMLQFPIEHKRLAALCKELNIHTFLTTRFTSAPGGAKIVFPLVNAFPYIYQIDPQSFFARDFLIATADKCLAMDDDGISYLHFGYNVPKSKIQNVGNGSAADHQKIAENIAAAILAA
jgi:hypothetical protein